MNEKRYTKISGIGDYLPTKVVTNHELAKRVDTSHEWIVERTGIQQRCVADDSESIATMGEQAAQKALQQSGITSEALDGIIVATCTPDHFFPSAACVLQHRLGARKNIPAFDLNAACSGFVYALSVANDMIQNGSAEHMLVVGSELLTRGVDWNDRTTCVLFGDGAGAVVLSASNKPGILGTRLYADGEYGNILSLSTHLNRLNHHTNLEMSGREVFRLAVERMSDSITDVLKQSGYTLNDIDWFVPHQANLRIIRMVAQRLNINEEKVIITVDQHANTSSASIPLALSTAVQDGRIQPDQLILMEAFGGGVTWGSVLLRWV